MARYEFDPNKVEAGISELQAAISQVSDITGAFQSGASAIQGAQGAEFMSIDFSQLNQLQPAVEDALNSDIQQINAKAEAIKEYNEAPWYVKVGSTVALFATKVVEGFATGIENIGDGAAMLVGAVGGIISPEFRESVAEYVAKDHVGDFANSLYEGDGIFGDIAKYSAASKDSGVMNFAKGVGTAAPYIALAMTGAGVGLQATAAGVSTMGRVSETDLQNGASFGQAFTHGAVRGAVDAALVFAMNKGAEKIANRAAAKTDTNFVENGFMGAQTGKVARGLDAAQDAAGNLISKIPGSQAVANMASKAGTVLSKIPGAGLVKSIGGAAVNVVGKIPGSVLYAGGAGILTAEQTFNNNAKADLAVARRQIEDIDGSELAQIATNPNTLTKPQDIFSAQGDLPPAGGGGDNPGDTPIAGDTPPTGGNPGGGNPGGGNPGGGNPGGGNTGGGNTGGGNTGGGNTGGGNTGGGNTGGGNDPIIGVGPGTGGGSTGGGPSIVTPTQDELTSSIGIDDIDINSDSILDSDVSGSLSELLSGNDFVNIPTSSGGIITTPGTRQKKSIIPIVAGLGAATVAGLGAKVYMDKKDEDESENLSTEDEDWVGNESVDLGEYSDSSDNEKDYLSPTDEFAFQEDGSDSSYQAVSNSDYA